MNRQKVFAKIKSHLLKQKKRAARGESCLYRGPKGTKCAVGCIIKDKFYSKKLETRTPDDEMVREAIRNSLGLKTVTYHQVCFLQELQSIHDDILPEDWAGALKMFARENRLAYGRAA